jgi:FMN phosphatase YigB (HAD superfamily)
MVIRLIALDVYETILATDDSENQMPPRKGFVDFIKKYRNKGKLIVSASDIPVNCQRKDLKSSLSHYERVYHERLYLEDLFDNFFQLTENPKEFKRIIEQYNLRSEEILVIGDNYDKDIKGAIKSGCRYYHVPEFRLLNHDGSFFDDSFSFSLRDLIKTR